MMGVIVKVDSLEEMCDLMCDNKLPGGECCDMNEIKVMLEKWAYAPERAHSADAGLDLKSPVNTAIRVGESAVIDTGVHVLIPEGYVGMLKSKSGLNVKYGLQSEGVIDAGYTGRIIAKIYNHGDKSIFVERGDKITQLVILPVVTPAVRIVDSLPETERGDGGFGSTGR